MENGNFLAVLKGKVAGLWGKIKGIVTVTTVAEAKARRKKALVCLIISIGVSLLPVIFDDVKNGVVETLVGIAFFIGFIATIAFVCVYIALGNATKSLILSECENCKEQIAYDGNVEFNVLREWVKKEVKSTKDSVNVYQTEIAEITVCCTCQKCGTAKSFKGQFNLAKYHNGNLQWSRTAGEAVRDFFVKHHF